MTNCSVLLDDFFASEPEKRKEYESISEKNYISKVTEELQYALVNSTLITWHRSEKLPDLPNSQHGGDQEQTEVTFSPISQMSIEEGYMHGATSDLPVHDEPLVQTPSCTDKTTVENVALEPYTESNADAEDSSAAHEPCPLEATKATE